jgi:hypothetical protein
VLRTLGVFIAALFLGFVILGSLLWAMYSLPWPVRIYAYYMAETLTGSAVGSFVGLMQKHGAGFVALTSLLPPAYLQYFNRFSHPAPGLHLFLLLVGTAVELSIAFVIAHRLSEARRRVGVSHA